MKRPVPDYVTSSPLWAGGLLDLENRFVYTGVSVEAIRAKVESYRRLSKLPRSDIGRLTKSEREYWKALERWLEEIEEGS